MYILPPLNSRDVLQKKTFQPKIKAEMFDSWEDVKRVVHQGLFDIPEIIKIELTSHFDIKKIKQLVARKNYENLQSLPIPIYCWKDLSINFVTGLFISTD